MGHLILKWAAPLYLIGFEVAISAAANYDFTPVVGPMLASVGIGFLLPLLKPKVVESQISPQMLSVVKDNGFKVVSEHRWQ